MRSDTASGLVEREQKLLIAQRFIWKGYALPEANTGPAAVTHLSVDRVANSGFSKLSLTASPGMLFVGDVTLAGRRADGSMVFDRINLGAPRLMAESGSNVRVEAGIVDLVRCAL